MRLRVNTIALIGAERRFSPKPGLNIITGPIATGKTTLIRCVRVLLGDRPDNFPRKTREVVTNLGGEVVIGQERYDIVRPFVSTATAKVDIAGRSEAQRLPAYRESEGGQATYSNWLLEKLNLPRINVPTAPTKPESDTSPLSINDYMMYCHLRQDEIDSSVFGHNNQFKNNKRMFVFEVVYGKYDVEVSTLQEERREIYAELRRLKGQAKTIEEFVSGTAFENRAVIERDLRTAESDLNQITTQAHSVSEAVVVEADSVELKKQLFAVEVKVDELQRRLQFEQSGAEQKERLIAQLQTQSTRLTRSVVAGEYLLDFDFVHCPRCGSDVGVERGGDENCYLCLQHPEPQITRDDMINEQDRIEKQIAETRELVAQHAKSVQSINEELASSAAEREFISKEIDHRTKRYVSDRAEQIAQMEGVRTALQGKVERLRDYLGLYKRQDAAASRIAQLESRYAELEAAIDAALSSESEFNERVHFLEETFRAILERIRVPRYANPGPTGIDRRTYLPLFDGRRFDELQSQGLQVMVNVAHAVAHQLTALHFGLPLPNILLIDGLTGNIGYEGLDLERVEAIYKFLMNIAQQHGDELQIIVADNSVPSFAKDFLLYEFSDDDKLIPMHLLSSTEQNGSSGLTQ